MKREIKFRGIRIDNGEWVFGYLDYYQARPQISYEIVEIPSLSDPGGTWIYKHFEVYPETAGQYTGLKDKNGKEIYEGDLLSFDTTNRQLKDVVFEVRWDNERAEFSKWHPRDKVIIVGNIHQTPDLLK